MKHHILLALAVFGVPSLAIADSINRQQGATMRELPGNAYIVEDNDSGRDGIRIDGDESILYHTLFGDYPNRRLRHGTAQSDVMRVCGGTTDISDRNDCIRDYMEEREDLMEEYND